MAYAPPPEPPQQTEEHSSPTPDAPSSPLASAPTPRAASPKTLTLATVLSTDPDDDDDDDELQPTIPDPPPAKDASISLAKAISSAEGGNDGGKPPKLPTGRWKIRRPPAFARKEEIRDAELGLRFAAAALSAVSFSVMAVDSMPGWDGDTFARYDIYRYALAANVVAFVYSAYQIFSELRKRITVKLLVAPQHWSLHLNLAMDQILAYLLMSATSAAVAQNDVWVSRFGGDHFTALINMSASMSFLAFCALALSSIISAYNSFGSLGA